MNEPKDMQLFSRMGEASKDGYFIFDCITNTFSYLNNSVSSIHELGRQLILEKPESLMQNLAADDLPHVQSCYQELLEDGGEKKYIYRLELSPARTKYLKCTAFLMENGAGQSICGMLEDITIQRQNEIHIEQINARKNVTLEVLAHDLKEPFAMIKMAASSLHAQQGQIDEQILQSSLSFINEMCERNIKFIRSMVNHEFLKSSIVAIKKERADVIWELQDVVRFYNRSHLKNIRKFNFESSDEKIYISLDSMKFMQVVNNLISNSIKFTPEGGSIDVYAQDRGETVLISVADNGIGMSPEIKDNLFKNSKEVLRKGLNGEESGGLGMSIIKDIVDLHRGKIWLISEVNVGTTFYIELPKDLDPIAPHTTF